VRLADANNLDQKIMLGDDPKVTSRSSWAVALRAALTWPVAKRSLIIMAVVGTVLNSINQGDALLSGRPVDWWKIALTYCVPFCVATYGAFCAFKSIKSE